MESIVALHREGATWEEAVDDILSRLSGYHPTHLINNAALVTASLLWGEGDFDRTIALAVMSGLDTDCNGATCGSVMGVMLGSSKIPERWWRPLNDTVSTALSGLGGLRITELARRTLELVKRALS